MLRVKDEENSQGGSRGRGLSRKWADELSEDMEEEEEEEEIFSESELELYEQYKAAGYRDLVSVCVMILMAFAVLFSALQPLPTCDCASCHRCGTARRRRRTHSRIT